MSDPVFLSEEALILLQIFLLYNINEWHNSDYVCVFAFILDFRR
jgi:hypothetical protein